MKILIVGGGIGGLMTACALSRQGLRDVTVLEQAGTLAPIGAGVQLAANAVRVLRHHGFMEKLDQIGVRGIGTWYKDLRTDELLHKSETGAFGEAHYGAPYIFAHRADLQQMLLDALPAGCLRTGASVVLIENTASGAAVELASGERLEADIVIGADGLNSRVRDFVTPRVAPDFSGVVTWRALIPREKVEALGLSLEPACHDWMGPDRIVAVYWCAGGRLLNLLAAVPAAEPAPESWATSDASGLLQESFADAHPKVRALLGAAASPFVTGIFDRPVLDTFHKGRVVLLGDAAHPFVPYLSNGAAQAIEDAHVMATVLARADAGAMSIDEAIPEYEQRRRARVDTVQRMSRESLRTHHLADPASIAERNERYRRAQQSDPQGATLRMWLWGYDVIADADRPLQAAALGKTALERLPVP